MRIIGFNLLKTSVERKEKPIPRPKITQNVDIKDVTKEKIPISDQEVLKIRFNFVISYSGDFAKLEFEGNVIALPGKEGLKDFLKSWKDKKIPEDVRIGLFNFIMSKCNVKALQLEDEMGLPLHVPMFRLKGNQEPR
jgi:hypothetical protein